LPSGTAEWLTEPFKRFLRIESVSGAALFFFASVAVILTNSLWAPEFLELWEVPVGLALGPYEYVRSVRDWLNEGLMTLFFFLVETVYCPSETTSSMASPRRAFLPRTQTVTTRLFSTQFLAQFGFRRMGLALARSGRGLRLEDAGAP
jgi:NhaA family Na+:H+ antiporter